MRSANQLNQQVFLGVDDWRRPEWNGVFYPSDLPPDWELTFFNTQFSCAWLPYAEWSQLTVQQVLTWIEDTHEGFFFILERPEVANPDNDQVLKAFGSRLGLLTTKDDKSLLWFGANPDVKLIASRVQSTKPQEAIFLISHDGDLAGIEQVRTLLNLLGV